MYQSYYFNPKKLYVTFSQAIGLRSKTQGHDQTLKTEYYLTANLRYCWQPTTKKIKEPPFLILSSIHLKHTNSNVFSSVKDSQRDPHMNSCSLNPLVLVITIYSCVVTTPFQLKLERSLTYLGIPPDQSHSKC